MQPSPKPFIVPIFIPHAGCPHRCAFCDQRRTTSQSEPLPPPELLHATIQRFLNYRRDPDRYTEISFYGGNFLGLDNNKINALLDLAGQYVRRSQAHGIRFSTRPDTIDQERIDLIRPFPVTTIELGVQSMNNDLLAISRRGHSADQVCHAVGKIREHPIGLGLQMMVGLPGEDRAAVLATAVRLASLAPDFVRIYPTLVLAGSPLERWFHQGKYLPLSLEEAVMRAKAAYTHFYSCGIPVARMGLQPTDELNQGAGVTAGPFHPAFGELVYATLWRDLLDDALGRYQSMDAKAVIQVHPKSISRLKGNKKSNVKYLTTAHRLSAIAFAADEELPQDTILVNGHRLSLADFVNSAQVSPVNSR